MVALSRSDKVVRRLVLVWGVYPHLLDKDLRFNEYVLNANSLVCKLRFAEKGQSIIMLSGLAAKNIETNAIYVHKVE